MTSQPDHYLVLASPAGGTTPDPPAALVAGYRAELWRPRLLPQAPGGPSSRRFTLWWLAHHSRMFRNRDYAVLLIRDAQGAVVHRSVAFPSYFAFPFMAKNDLQIGFTWTDEAHRGRGLATAAIRLLVQRLQRPRRVFWYVVEETNLPSVRASISAGLQPAGRASRRVPLGIGALGRYSLTSAPTVGSGDSTRTARTLI